MTVYQIAGQPSLPLKGCKGRKVERWSEGGSLLEPRQQPQLHLETSNQPPSCRESYHLASFHPAIAFLSSTRLPFSSLTSPLLLLYSWSSVETWLGIKGRLGPSYLPLVFNLRGHQATTADCHPPPEQMSTASARLRSKDSECSVRFNIRHSVQRRIVLSFLRRKKRKWKIEILWKIFTCISRGGIWRI